MRILVDTSVWVDFFNGRVNPAAEALVRLIDKEIEILTCGVIVAEFLQGIRDRNTLPTLIGHFQDMDWLTPTEPETYIKAAAMFRKLRSHGITIRSTIDCLIVQLADENNAMVLSKDRDFDLILNSGVVDVKPLPGV